MQAGTTRSAIDKKTGRQQVFVCLLLFPFVLFTLSGFTFIPNTAQRPKQATETTLPLTLQMSTKLTLSAADESCTDTIYIVQSSSSEIKIYFNVCALQHLSAIVAGVDAATAAVNLITLVCSACAPLDAWISTVAAGIAAGITANLAFLQYASHLCGGDGAYLDISWTGGWQFEPSCGA